MKYNETNYDNTIHIEQSEDNGELLSSEENIEFGIITETTSDKCKKYPNGDKWIDLSVHDEKPYRPEVIYKAIDNDAYLICDYHIKEGDARYYSKKINDAVGKNEWLIYMGDIDPKHEEPNLNTVKEFLSTINTKNICLILGNNDSFLIKDYVEAGAISVITEITYNGLCLTHFPRQMKNGMINLHGHNHGAALGNLNNYWYCDGFYNYDTWDNNYRPKRISQCIYEYLNIIKDYPNYKTIIKNIKYNPYFKNNKALKDTFKEYHLLSTDTLNKVQKKINTINHFRDHKPMKSYSEDILDEIINESVSNRFQVFTETTISESSNFFKDRIESKVNTALTNPQNVRQFNKIVSDFVNRNIFKLSKSGPCDMVPFTDTDHKALFDLFGFEYNVSMKAGTKSPNEITNMVKEFSKKTHIKLSIFENNPTQVLLYYVIRYFTIKNDTKNINTSLLIYALCVYPLMFNKYFPKGVIESVMTYTIDNLTDKYIFKRGGNVMNSLLLSIQSSYSFHKNNFKSGNDNKMVAWVERIRNDQNSLFKKLANEYIRNWKEGNYAREINDMYDGDTPIIDEVNNATTVVNNIVNKVTLPIIENGIDIVRAEAAAKMSQVSVSDCRYFLTIIISTNNLQDIQAFIEAVLFLYLYEGHRNERDIRSQFFLSWSASLFKKTNAKNDNIQKFNEILNKWADASGIYKKFAREASRINYKKAIFFYLILMIQKNI